MSNDDKVVDKKPDTKKATKAKKEVKKATPKKVVKKKAKALPKKDIRLTTTNMDEYNEVHRILDLVKERMNLERKVEAEKSGEKIGRNAINHIEAFLYMYNNMTPPSTNEEDQSI